MNILSIISLIPFFFVISNVILLYKKEKRMSYHIIHEIELTDDIRYNYEKITSWLNNINAKIIRDNFPSIIIAKHKVVSQSWDFVPEVFWHKQIELNYIQFDDDTILRVEIQPDHEYKPHPAGYEPILNIGEFLISLYNELDIVIDTKVMSQLYSKKDMIEIYNKYRKERNIMSLYLILYLISAVTYLIYQLYSYFFIFVIFVMLAFMSVSAVYAEMNFVRLKLSELKY